MKRLSISIIALLLLGAGCQPSVEQLTQPEQPNEKAAEITQELKRDVSPFLNRTILNGSKIRKVYRLPLNWNLIQSVQDEFLGSITTSTADDATYISEDAATTNYGSNTKIYVTDVEYAQQFALVRIAMPAGSETITDVSLFINKEFSGAGSTIVYELLQPNWTENGSTWNTYDGSNGWNTAGALGVGTDYSSTVIDTVSNAFTGYGEFGLMGSAAGGTPLTINWEDTVNLKLVMGTTDQSTYFRSDDDGAGPPYFEITTEAEAAADTSLYNQVLNLEDQYDE